MLTPTSDDPNRANELKRKAQDPGSFGAQHDRDIKDAVAQKQKEAKAREQAKE